ncbi:MAG: D-2-hydroxyacid dehydrogenase [Armatimonadetes bacterium]|nr:D-2-hydroxyacid dehydrogenase [Armatimonadota bacterium]
MPETDGMKVLITLKDVDPNHPLLRAIPGVTYVVAGDAEAIRREAVEAEVVWGFGHLETVLEVATRLRWVAATSAGVERFLQRLQPHPEIILTTGAGAYDVPIAEHVFALLLAVRRDLGYSVRNAVAHRWEPRRGMRELAGSTLGIVGLGKIGREVARAGSQGFNLRVLGHKLRESAPPEGVERLFYGRDGLHAMLRECDQVVVAAALSPASRHLLDGAALDCLPPHAVVVNIGRGQVIDQAALLARLQDGRLAGAGLDVFEVEPLPDDDPLWELPQVIITAHNAGTSQRVRERQLALFASQLQRFVAGEPLENVADRAQGY